MKVLSFLNSCLCSSSSKYYMEVDYHGIKLFLHYFFFFSLKQRKKER